MTDNDRQHAANKDAPGDQEMEDAPGVEKGRLTTTGKTTKPPNHREPGSLDGPGN